MDFALEASVNRVLEGLSYGIEMISVVILIVGSVRFVMNVVGGVVKADVTVPQALQRARIGLGVYILAALEFLIVADIIFTVVHRTLDDVIVLAIVAAVRTVVSWFLGKEIEALSHDEGIKAGLKKGT
ncbi:DUF1622 domain-containing protein [Parvularcula flava]|uniref:DUF1622 domain-containing protein n=1 Tax=Aquisalinus luteolus TaxID=1566827 RepID=A0A8J3A6C9_9PROT|nr:DUF1622 domain-containing protein [Aquisalinus luteolus]NHK27768.1 DUF1622 domain-containing protein [Aquisalinus luteolus]GGH96441.1 hypothetical protein GCM10011355_15350 [Aquisalinus luteolus]